MKVVGFTKKQRDWIKQRDGNRCQMFTYRNGKWVQCPVTVGLQVHHIIPRGWAEKHLPEGFNLNSSVNGICLCGFHHVGKSSVHPDTYKAKLAYQAGNKDAYREMSERRKVLNEQGIPYWNTQFDWLFQRRIKKLNLKMLKTKPYPTNSRRGNNGRL